jgi:hypothetical protein
MEGVGGIHGPHDQTPAIEGSLERLEGGHLIASSVLEGKPKAAGTRAEVVTRAFESRPAFVELVRSPTLELVAHGLDPVGCDRRQLPDGLPARTEHRGKVDLPVLCAFGSLAAERDEVLVKSTSPGGGKRSRISRGRTSTA